MTDHLPECHTSMIPDFHNERWICICPALRACEERMREGWYEVQSETWVQGYAAGLDAARAAVATISVRKDTSWDMRVQALAAIDALRENND